jgi:phosphatidylserine decarboxylase
LVIARLDARSLHTGQQRSRHRLPGSRGPHILVSPCDAIVGACGAISGTTVCQVKGFPYTLEDLLGDAALVDFHRDGVYVTLRLSSSMYHRFHAPHDCRVDRVVYISGDTWNVNPIALRRIEKLFCKNERCVLRMRLAATGQPLTLVPVAAVLVACLQLVDPGIRCHNLLRSVDIALGQRG